MPIILRTLCLVTAVLCNARDGLEHGIPRRSFLSRRAIDGTRGRKYFDPGEEGSLDSFGSAGGQYEPYDYETDFSDIRRNVPGEPGIDYPAYTTLPQTGFTCEQRARGYYADEAAGCQVFHVCHDVLVSSFLCPVGSIFSQRLLTCDWWTKVDCSSTGKFVAADRDGHQVDDDDEMIRKAYAMISLQSGADVTRDGLADPDAGVRILDYASASYGSAYQAARDRQPSRQFLNDYDDYRYDEEAAKTSPSYQNTLDSGDRRTRPSYQDSPIIRVQTFRDHGGFPGHSGVGNDFREFANQFQPSYAPTVPTVTTTTRRLYSPTVPTTFRPSTSAYGRFDQEVDSSDHLYAHSREVVSHVTRPVRPVGTNAKSQNDGSSLERNRTVVESHGGGSKIHSTGSSRGEFVGARFEDDIDAKQSIGLGRAIGQQTVRNREQDIGNDDRKVQGSFKDALKDSSRGTNSSEYSSDRRDDDDKAGKHASDSEEGSAGSADYYDGESEETTTVLYESQEFASTFASGGRERSRKHEVSEDESTESIVPTTATLIEKHSTTIGSETKSIADRSGPVSRMDTGPRFAKPDEFLKPPAAVGRVFRINVPDQVTSLLATYSTIDHRPYPGSRTTLPARFSNPLPADVTESPRFEKFKDTELGKVEDPVLVPEKVEHGDRIKDAFGVEGPDTSSLEAVGHLDGVTETTAWRTTGFGTPPIFKASLESSTSSPWLASGWPDDEYHAQLPVAEVLPPVVDYNDGFDDFLAPFKDDEDDPSIEQTSSSLLKDNSRVKVSSGSDARFKVTVRDYQGSPDDEGHATTPPSWYSASSPRTSQLAQLSRDSVTSNPFYGSASSEDNPGDGSEETPGGSPGPNVHSTTGNGATKPIDDSTVASTLLRSIRPETLEQIEETIQRNNSPYQVSLTLDKDDGPKVDGLIERLIAQHERKPNSTLENNRNDFEIVKSVEPRVKDDVHVSNATVSDSKQRVAGEFQPTVRSITRDDDSSSVKDGKGLAEVGSVSLLQLMAELLKIDRLPRPFSFKDSELKATAGSRDSFATTHQPVSSRVHARTIEQGSFSRANGSKLGESVVPKVQRTTGEPSTPSADVGSSLNRWKVSGGESLVQSSTASLGGSVREGTKERILERLAENFGKPLYSVESTIQLPQVQRYLDFETGLPLRNLGRFTENDATTRTTGTDAAVSATTAITTTTTTTTTTTPKPTTTTEAAKTIVETEFVPALGFSFDTDRGREEYVEAVLGGLLNESTTEIEEYAAKESTVKNETSTRAVEHVGRNANSTLVKPV